LIWGKKSPSLNFFGFSKVLGRGLLSSLHSSLKTNLGDQGWVIEWDEDMAPPPSTVVVACDPLVMAGLPLLIEFDAIQIVRSSLNNQGAIPLIGKAQVEFSKKKSVEVQFQVEPSLKLDTLHKPFGSDPPTLSRSILSTVRIRISDFGLPTPDDIAAITSLRLKFTVSRGLIAFSDIGVVL